LKYKRQTILRVTNVFDPSSFEVAAKLSAAAIFGLVPYFIFQFIAPKLGLVDESASSEQFKDGEEPWNRT
jgi:hypothetical protein